MGLTAPGDERVVIAAARELANIMTYRGLSPDQTVQALIAVSASALSAWSQGDHDLLKENVDMFCKQIRMRSKGVYPAKKNRR